MPDLETPATARPAAAVSLPMVFLDGGVPGVARYCAGGALWGEVTRRFSQEVDVSVLEWARVVECGADNDTPTFELALTHVAAALRALKLPPCHLVAHDVAGLAAIHLACTSPDLVAVVTVCSSVAACPTGDGVENLTLAYPPGTAGSRAAQRWALERLSYSHQHVDDALLQACEANAESPAWKHAAEQLQSPMAAAQWASSVSRAKARLFEIARGAGVPAPVQLVWGSDDPIAPLDQALWLYRVVAQSQPRTQFHVINRTGAFPFREEPGAFHQIVAAFNEAACAGA